MESHRVNKPGVLPICEECNEIFENEKLAHKHFKIKHLQQMTVLTYRYFETVMCCEFCESAFETEEVVVKHKSQCHTGPTPYECQNCFATYDTYSKLKTHGVAHKSIKTVFPIQRQYVCDVCLKPYSDWRNLQCHRKTVHLINPSIFRCKDCDATFYKSWDFSYHKKSVHGDPVPCPLCNQKFATNKSMTSHMNKIHLNEKPKRAKTVSKRKIVQMDDAQMQIRTMIEKTNDMKWACKICKKMCASRTNAVAHVAMVHMRIENFHCEICNKGFYQKGDLNDHFRIVS